MLKMTVFTSSLLVEISRYGTFFTFSFHMFGFPRSLNVSYKTFHLCFQFSNFVCFSSGHPSVTMAPDCDSDSVLPVLQRPDPPTELSLLSQSVMDQQVCVCESRDNVINWWLFACSFETAFTHLSLISFLILKK